MAGRHTLARSFGFAWDGLVEGALRERNLRVHLALGVLAGAFAARAPLAPAERALLVLCIALVVAAEAANSALEAVVDLVAPGFDERARVAKDAAAAAVLALAAGSVLVFLAVAAGGQGLSATLGAAGLLGAPGAGALAAALAAGLLPAPGALARAAGVPVAALGLAGLAAFAQGARSHAGTAAATLCLAVAAGAALRRRRRP